MDYFQKLGESVGTSWKLGDSLDEFTEAATLALNEVPPDRVIDTQFMLDWANEQRKLPKQVNFQTGFGEPPLVVFLGDGFYIEVLYWFTSRTGIHGHAFAGAFRVLAGHSLQTVYSFAPNERICEGLQQGSLELKNAQWLGPGDVAPINAADRFIHCVAHLGRPSITLVIRTETDANVRQYSYSRSGLAWRSNLRKQEHSRRMALIRARQRERDDNCVDDLQAMVRSGDPYRCLMTLFDLDRSRVDDEMLQRVALAGCPKAEHRDHLLNAVQELKKGRKIWRAIKDFPPNHQLAIAVNELLPPTSSVHQTLEKYFPGTVNEILENWSQQVRL